MIWYGPSGIGTARSLEGFIDHHQLPFRKTFKKRNYWELGHYCDLEMVNFHLLLAGIAYKQFMAQMIGSDIIQKIIM